MQDSFESNKKIRVIMVLPYYFPQYGGAENQARLISKWLTASGSIEVTVLTLHLFGGASKECLDGNVILRFGEQHNEGIILNGLRSILAWLRLHQKSYDIVHQHFIFGQFPEIQLRVGLLCAEIGKPCILKITSSEKVKLLCASSNWGKYFLNCYSKIVAINNDIESELIAANVPRERIIRMRNGVDVDKFRPPMKRERDKARKEVGLSITDFAVLFTGRLVEKKHLPILLRACKEVKSHKSAIRLLIVGDDESDRTKLQPDNVPVANELKLLANELSIECNWVGYLSDWRDIRNYYWCSDCFCLPSRNEGCSNALLEAMSCGLPCVTSKISANTEILGIMTSLAFTLDDIDGLANNINILLESDIERKRFGMQGRYLATTQYDVRNIVKKYENIYQELVLSNYDGLGNIVTVF